MTLGRAYVTLLVFLGFTFGVSFLPLGYANDILAWFFALAKAFVIFTVFMKYRREYDDSRIYFILGLLTILLLLVGVIDDVLFRP